MLIVISSLYMNNQNLIIYDFQILFEILNEVKTYLNFDLIHLSKEEYSENNLNKIDNYLIISKSKNKILKNQILIENYPCKLINLIETINIKFLKKNFYQQSDINIGMYKLNLNSRKIIHENKILNLTEKETDIIIFLKKSKRPVTVSQLQKEVWGHNLQLETHTVETHIYRLRKKISDNFNNNNFIQSSKSGYIIK